MKLSLLLVSYLATITLGFKLFGGYERMYFWYAYQIDIATNGGKASTIALACKGSGPGGTCNFNEFVKYINKINILPPITNSLLPDVDATAAALDAYTDVPNLGKQGLTGIYVVNRVVPGAKTLPDLLLKVGGLIQAQGTALSTADLVKLTSAQTASQRVLALRRADFSRWLVPRLQAAAPGLSPVLETIDAVPGSTSEVLDIGATNRLPANQNTLKAFNLPLFIKQYQSGGRAELAHQNIINAARTAMKLTKTVCLK